MAPQPQSSGETITPPAVDNPSFLFNPTLRFALLRTILALGIILLCLRIQSSVTDFQSLPSSSHCQGSVEPVFSFSSDDWCATVPDILYIAASVVVLVHHLVRWVCWLATETLGLIPVISQGIWRSAQIQVARYHGSCSARCRICG